MHPKQDTLQHKMNTKQTNARFGNGRATLKEADK